jgi:hypothetical protein
MGTWTKFLIQRQLLCERKVNSFAGFRSLSDVMAQLAICLSFVFTCQLALAQGSSDLTSTEVRNMIQSGPPASGEIAVKKTLFHALQGIPPKPIGLSSVNYQAAWLDNDFLLQELTPESSNPTNPVTGLLIGENTEFYWFVQANELSVFKNLNDGQNGTNKDGNMVSYYINYGKSTVRSFFAGYDFDDVHWDGDHLTAAIAGSPIEADLKFENQIPVLEGRSTEKGINGQFRIEYLDWGKFDGRQYPRNHKIYSKFSGEKDYALQIEVWITEFKTPYMDRNPLDFNPSRYINTNYFHTFAYISNKVFQINSDGALAQVRDLPIPMPTKKPPLIFVRAVLVISLLFIPLAFFIRRYFKWPPNIK